MKHNKKFVKNADKINIVNNVISIFAEIVLKKIIKNAILYIMMIYILNSNKK
jgi:hypothetical protein